MMKKHLLKLLFLFSFLLGLNQISAQSWQINYCSTPTASSTFGPMNSAATVNATSRFATIYPASQLAGITNQTLNSIWFNRSTATGTMAGTPNFKIYLLDTTATEFGAGGLIGLQQLPMLH